MAPRIWTLLCACSLAGCTGVSLGENNPGGDTWVDPDPPRPGEHRMGAIAVERDEDQVWVVHEENRGGVIEARLAAIDPATGITSAVLDVSGLADRRVVFPADDRMILLGASGGRDRLVLIDTETNTPLVTTSAPARYWGTRTAPSGRALVVADNLDPLLPLHVIDTATLEHQVIEHGGDTIEGMWNHHEDVFIALSVTDPFGEEPVARLLRYDLRDADLSAPLPAPTVAWELAGYGWDSLFSYTWVGISPDDRWAVFPLIKRTAGPEDGDHVLLVLDQASGAVSLVPGRGPVGFTRDSQWIVSYDTRPGGGQDLWLIDPDTHERRTVTMPFTAGVSFIVSSQNDTIVCDPVLGEEGREPLAVYDIGANTLRTIDQPDMDLWEYVTRPGTDELWLASGGEVFVLSTGDATIEEVPLDSRAIDSLNVRPSADQALAGDGADASIRRVAMARREQDGDIVALPSPFDSSPQALPALRGRSIAERVQSPFDPRYRAPARIEHAGAITARSR